MYCKLPTNGKQLPDFPLEAVPGIEPRHQRWEARVLPLCHCGWDELASGGNDLASGRNDSVSGGNELVGGGNDLLSSGNDLVNGGNEWL